jgi:hypothetical protein
LGIGNPIPIAIRVTNTLPLINIYHVKKIFPFVDIDLLVEMPWKAGTAVSLSTFEMNLTILGVAQGPGVSKQCIYHTFQIRRNITNIEDPGSPNLGPSWLNSVRRHQENG